MTGISRASATTASVGRDADNPQPSGFVSRRYVQDPHQDSGCLCSAGLPMIGGSESGPVHVYGSSNRAVAKFDGGEEASGKDVQHQRQEIVILETFEAAEDALHAGQYPAAMRLLRQGIATLDMYAQERVLIQRIERNGLDAPSVVRSLAEYRARRDADNTA